jgi:folate-binding protein YgfZ
MTIPSPLHDCISNYELAWTKPESETRVGASTGYMEEQLLCEFLPWGDGGCSILATTGSVELEYAAMRKNVGVFDAGNRGTIYLLGEERLPFIDRMTTQKLSDMKVGESRLAFILDRKGRIVADVIVVCEDYQVLIDCDVTTVQSIIEHFEKYIVTDDVIIQNETKEKHRLWLLGPCVKDIKNVVSFGNAQFNLPQKFLGIDGIAIVVDQEEAEHVWRSLIKEHARPIGWNALNMIRVEELTPMFRIDFDNANLPHETSLCDSRVRFDKGCYLGQEIVARMESLGRPKQQLISLKLDGDALPVAGTQIWNQQSTKEGKAIGVVTSSAMSPLRGGDIAVIAMVKSVSASKNTEVFPWIGSELIRAVIHPLSPKEEMA